MQRAREIDCELSLINAPALEIAIEELDWFGGLKPRAVIARVNPTPALLALQADHERAIRRAGVAPDKRKFSPHITIARLRDANPLQLADYLGAKSAPRGWTFIASEFVLFSARASVGGGPYHCEATYPLDHRPALRPAKSQ